MVKKLALLFMLCAFIASFYGCEASKNVVKKADEWVQKTLW